MTNFIPSDLTMLHGKPININGICNVFPLTLSEIDDMNEEKYIKLLNAFVIDKKTLIEHSIINSTIDKIDDYSIIRMLSLSNKDFMDSVIESLHIFLREEIIFINEIFYIKKSQNDFQIIDNDLFDAIKMTIRHQNYLESSNKKETHLKAFNKKAQELMELEQKRKSFIQERNKNKGLHLSDIISIVCSYSQTISIGSVWELTVYQLYEIYFRLIMWDNFHINCQLMPYASAESPKPEHWAKPVDKNNI